MSHLTTFNIRIPAKFESDRDAIVRAIEQLFLRRFPDPCLMSVEFDDDCQRVVCLGSAATDAYSRSRLERIAGYAVADFQTKPG